MTVLLIKQHLRWNLFTDKLVYVHICTHCKVTPDYWKPTLHPHSHQQESEGMTYNCNSEISSAAWQLQNSSSSLDWWQGAEHKSFDIPLSVIAQEYNWCIYAITSIPEHNSCPRLRRISRSWKKPKENTTTTTKTQKEVCMCRWEHHQKQHPDKRAAKTFIEM